MRCASTQLRPGLAEMEEIAEQIVRPYCAFVYDLLHPRSEGEAASRTSLVGETCNPEIEISITHPNFPKVARAIKLSPTTDGESVKVLYEGLPREKGEGPPFALWGWQTSEDGQHMDCVQLS